MEIYELPGSKQKKTNITADLVNKIIPKELSVKPEKKVSILTVATKFGAYLRATDMSSNHIWTYNTDDRTPLTTTTKPPGHLNFTPSSSGSTEQGIPYAWGGMNGYDTGTSGTYINFYDGLVAGKTAGNIDTDAYYVSTTVGLDCSGLISAADNFGTKYGTTNLSTVFKTTTWNLLERGDIGNKSGNHTWMLREFTTNSAGEKTGINTIESTLDGTVDAAKWWNRTWVDARTYVPMTLK